MSFTFDARTLLELGKELISTDEVAIFELVKNAVDADSKSIVITAQIHLRYSDYQKALDDLEDGTDPAEVYESLKDRWIESDHDTVKAAKKALRAVRDDPDAFEETLSSLYAPMNTLTFEDTGDGMSLKILKNVFLRIGTRSRRSSNKSGSKMLGDKGIGRLSAMRLGEQLFIATATQEDTHWNHLDIDWGLFDTEEEASVEDIDIEPYVGERKEDPAVKGTTIIISDLQGDWDIVRFSDIFTGRIARLIDPFETGLANKIIKARHNGRRILIPSIPAKLLDAAHASLDAKLSFVTDNDGNRLPHLTGKIAYPLQTTAVRTLDLSAASVASLASKPIRRRAKKGHAAVKVDPVNLKVLEQLGGFTCEVFWWNRRVVNAIDGLTGNSRETRDAIAEWSGGPMIYRYDYRVLPYGDPGNDWLELDKEAFSQKGFKLNRSQLIGRVKLDVPHSVLSEQTNREGLIEAPVFTALKQIMMWLMHVEMRSFIQAADDAARETVTSKAEKETDEIREAQKRVERVLNNIETQVHPSLVPEVGTLSTEIGRLSSKSSSLLKRFDSIVRENDAERRKLVYLAGVGLLTEFVFHELERAVKHAIDMIEDGHENPIEILKPQLDTLYKRVSAFDDMTAERRQSKTKFDLAPQIETLVSHHENEFARHDIDWDVTKVGGDFPVRAVKGMVIQIVENLVVNAAYWLKQEAAIRKSFSPRIDVVIDATARTVTIEDNGPGISPSRREAVFQPFITEKPSGTGRGLGLYIARELAEYHGWSLELDEDPNTADGTRLSRFVLSLG